MAKVLQGVVLAENLGQIKGVCIKIPKPKKSQLP